MIFKASCSLSQPCQPFMIKVTYRRVFGTMTLWSGSHSLTDYSVGQAATRGSVAVMALIIEVLKGGWVGQMKPSQSMDQYCNRELQVLGLNRPS